ncbi:MAG: hypothetical protein EOO40_03115 [Deltaproteobacteria bacterium]|nr:MAG: hypothetical protein EOO40_03115 [Deltaproteobacteria bacterium]
MLNNDFAEEGAAEAIRPPVRRVRSAPGVAESFQDVLERGQNLFFHRLELVQLEFAEALKQRLQTAVARLAATLLGAGAALFALLALYGYLKTLMLDYQAALVMSGSLGGIALVLWLLPQWRRAAAATKAAAAEHSP